MKPPKLIICDVSIESSDVYGWVKLNGPGDRYFWFVGVGGAAASGSRKSYDAALRQALTAAKRLGKEKS